MKKNRLSLIYILLFSVYILGGCTAIILSYVYHFNRESIGVVILICPLIALAFSRKSNINKYGINNSINKFKPHVFKIFLILFVLLSVISLIIAVISQKNYYLPVEFFIFIALTACLILVQIMSFNNLTKIQIYLILLEIFTFSSLIAYAFLFLFPGPIGFDSSYHIAFINNILNSGNINYSGNYSNYPLFHLLFASLVLITGIINFKIIQLILAIIQIFFFIFIFILTNKFFNEKIALISVLILSIIPYTIVPHYSYYPTAFSLTIFLMALYLFYELFKGSKFVILFLLSFVTLIFSHPLAPLYFLVISLLIVSASKSINLTKKYISIGGIILMTILMLTWWMKSTPFQTDLFSTFIISLQNAFTSVDYSDVGRATLSQFYSFKDILLYDLGFVMLIGFSIFGSFYAINNFFKNDNISKIDEKIIILIITLILIPIPYVMAILFPQSLPDRWFPFIGIFLSISASIGIYILFEKSLTSKIPYILLILIIFTTIFFNISSPIVNPNSHIYSEDLSSRNALTTSELNALQFTNLYGINNTKANSILISLFTYTNSSANYIDPSRPETYSKGLLVIRSYDIKNGFTIPLFGAKGQLAEVIPPTNNFSSFLNNSDQIYNNGNLTMYYN